MTLSDDLVTRLASLIEVMRALTTELDSTSEPDARSALWSEYDAAYGEALSILPAKPEPL